MAKRKKLTEEEKAGNARGRAFRKEKQDLLLNSNPIDHMYQLSNDRCKLQDYFYWVSPTWKAIDNHIARAKDCVLINTKGLIIISHRGTGPSISFRDWYTYNRDGGAYGISFEVEYFESEHELNSYDPRTFRKTYYLSIPFDLELNFTKKKFNTWLAEMKIKRDKETRKADLKELDRLKKLYPQGK